MEDDFKVTAQELPAAIESILFISGDPVSVDKLADILNCSKNAIMEALKSLTERYLSNPWGGLEIRRTEDSYAMMTRPSQQRLHPLPDSIWAAPRGIIPKSCAGKGSGCSLATTASQLMTTNAGLSPIH